MNPLDASSSSFQEGIPWYVTTDKGPIDLYASFSNSQFDPATRDEPPPPPPEDDVDTDSAVVVDDLPARAETKKSRRKSRGNDSRRESRETETTTTTEGKDSLGKEEHFDAEDEKEDNGREMSASQIEPARFDGRRKVLDANRYATKKTIAQGMLDVALLTANASQLKYVLQVGEENHPFYHLMLTLIIISIILQVIVGILFLVIGALNINDEPDQRKADIMNDVIVVVIFIITLVNVILNGFGIRQSDAGVIANQQATIPGK